MSTRKQLEQSLAGLESQRAILGDAIVDPAIAGIKMQLDALSPLPEPQSQRKQITVLFADVSGFTAMSETMDAEDVQTTMNALWQRVDQCILDHNGRIDKHIGDAVMALWGVNGAREDDPEQAIRAALAMQTAVYKFAAQQKFPLKMRIGLNTGAVLLGEVGTTAEFTAMGDAVNIAARLEHAAPIGGILISQAVYQHVRGVFDVEPQEPLTVKGKAEPLQVYVINRAKARAFRTGTRGVEGVETRMVGRDDELQTLQTAWQESVANSQTTLITVIGDAGVGKSRLLYEFENWLDLQPDTISLFRGRSAEQTQGTPYFLLRDLLATRFNIRESDPIADVRHKFEVGISETLSDEAGMKAHILGQWLGYDFSDSPHVIAIGEDAEQLKNRGLLYLSQVWVKMGGKRPLILLLEDIHWADTSSLDAILDILRREPALPMLVIALTRPSLFEHRPAWHNLGESDGVQVGGLEFQEPDYRFLTLDPLPSAADRELLAEILKKVPAIPEKLFNLVADRAEGNPFYMEELVKMLIDGGVILPDEELWQVNLSQLNEAQIPGTLTGVLQARLDRLQADEMVTLQRASVVGRVFWDTAVETLGIDQHHLQLRSLQTHEFIYQQKETTFVDTIQYLFKHDLLRDVTYQTVLKKARKLYHGQVAKWLATAAEKNERGDEYAAIIGEHYQAADELEKAAIWYGRAGKQASANFTHEGAIHYLSLAIKLSPKDDYDNLFTLLGVREKTYDMQGNREAQQHDLEKLERLGVHLSVIQQADIALRQAKYTRNISAYNQAIIHAKVAIELGKHDNEGGIAAGGYSLWGNILLDTNLPAGTQFQTGLTIARNTESQEHEANCLLGLAYVSARQGELTTAKEYLEQALPTYREIGNKRGEARCLITFGLDSTQSGNDSAAKKYHKQASDIYHEIGDRQGEGISLNNLGSYYMNQGDYAIAKTYCKQALTIYRKIRSQSGIRITCFNLGYIAWNEGDYTIAQTYYEQALVICRKMGLKITDAYHLVGLGMIAYNRNEYHIAQEYFEGSLSICRKSDDRVEGLGLTGLATISLLRGDNALAESYYQQAIAIHKKNQQRYYLFENWAGLAKAKVAQGDRKSAQQYGQQILVYLKEDPYLNATKEEEKNPMLALRFTWEVLVALEQTAEADHVLTLAAQIMQEYLDKNSDPAGQEMYLNQPHHKVLWAAWQEAEGA